ncbi:hypothetical protein NESM_000207500 [Novymonas esmeraldas]|uniref:Uncharacterized protein n=1 Tax=Novymonas esmeraldas TaxID=1808958 RepID=A0AAW0FA67_9TRYP
MGSCCSSAPAPSASANAHALDRSQRRRRPRSAAPTSDALAQLGSSPSHRQHIAVSPSASTSSLGSPPASMPRKTLDGGDRGTRSSSDGIASLLRSAHPSQMPPHNRHRPVGAGGADTVAFTTPCVESGVRDNAEERLADGGGGGGPSLAPRHALLSYLQQYRTLQAHVRPPYNNRRWRLVFSSDVHGTQVRERCQRVFTHEEQRWRVLRAEGCHDDAVAAARCGGGGGGGGGGGVCVPLLSLVETDLLVPAAPRTGAREDGRCSERLAGRAAADSHLCVGLYLHRVPEPERLATYARADVFLFLFETPVASPDAAAAPHGHAELELPAAQPPTTAAAARVRDLAGSVYADLDEAPVWPGQRGSSGGGGGDSSSTPERTVAMTTAPVTPQTQTHRRIAVVDARGDSQRSSSTFTSSPPPLMMAGRPHLERQRSLDGGGVDRGGLPLPLSPASPSAEVSDESAFSSRSCRSHSTAAGHEGAPMQRRALTRVLSDTPLSPLSPLQTRHAGAPHSPTTATTPGSMSEALAGSRDTAPATPPLLPASVPPMAAWRGRAGAATMSFDGDVVSATTTVVSATSIPGAPWREDEDLTCYWPEAHGGGGGGGIWRATRGQDGWLSPSLAATHPRGISRVSSLGGDDTADCYTPRQPRDKPSFHFDPNIASPETSQNAAVTASASASTAVAVVDGAGDAELSTPLPPPVHAASPSAPSAGGGDAVEVARPVCTRVEVLVPSDTSGSAGVCGDGSAVHRGDCDVLHVWCSASGDLYVWDPLRLHVPSAVAAARGPDAAALHSTTDGTGVAQSTTSAMTTAALREHAHECIFQMSDGAVRVNAAQLRAVDADEGVADGARAVARQLGETTSAAELSLLSLVRAHATAPSTTVGAGAADTASATMTATVVKLQLCAISSRPMPMAVQRVVAAL